MTIKDIVSIALFAAIIATLGLLPPIPVPIIPVPVTAQTLGVMLAGVFLGSIRAFYAVLVFLFLLAAGFPLLPGGHGGIGVFFGPTAGYLIGWALGAWLIGLLYEIFCNSLTSVKEIIFLFLGSIIGIYCPGIIWLSYEADISIYQVCLANLFFIPGDIIKVTIVFFIIRRLRKALPNALR
ncbi:MAG: biotin transport system substrate-specific component [Candidatus Tokpelaia sp. JSC085]|nr:MAG: biotin transport system substrate-specific component [Candidatus Tokpelaia sp. JSC085]